MELTSNITDFGTYEVGSRVKENGWYVCVPCGYKRMLKKGERFPSCLRCMEESENEYARDLELWEKIDK